MSLLAVRPPITLPHDLDLDRFLRLPQPDLLRLEVAEKRHWGLPGLPIELLRKHRISLLVVAMLILAATALLTDPLASHHSASSSGALPHHVSRASPSAHQPAVSLLSSATPRHRTLPYPMLQRLLGQHIMGSWRGSTVVPPEVLADIEAGRIGGVVLFADDVPSPTAQSYQSLIARLQAAASAGHQPPLLIAVDQEGGDVRRVTGPPNANPAQIAGNWSASFKAAGETARLLKTTGIDVDLAPVADTPAVAGAFIGQRAFSSSPSLASGAVSAFVLGLQNAHVAATAKHYPGLGQAIESTDLQSVRIEASRALLKAEMAPFRAAVASDVRLVMVSSAIYDALDPANPAVLSSRVIGELRAMDFAGVTVSDSMDTRALSAYGPEAAVRAVRAGMDILLYGNGDGASGYRALETALRSGSLDRHTLEASAERIIRLKRWLR